MHELTKQRFIKAKMIRALGKVALSLALVLLSGCSTVTRLEGWITDPQGQPLESATIMLDAGGLHGETQSKSDGSYYLSLVHPPGARWVTISKPGYKTVHKKLHGAIDVHLDVVLKPEKALKQP